MLLPDVAVWFQQNGFTALVYDNRTIGISDGEPRNEVDPRKLVEDYHDALTFLSDHPLVDPERIVYWGNSFSAMVVLVAAALDKRAAAVVSVAPITTYVLDPPEKGRAAMALAIRDRISRLAGNPPVYIPFVDDNGANPAGWGDNYSMGDFHQFLSNVVFTNQTTIQTYYHLVTWQPYGVIPLVSPTPVMMVTPENDNISLPENQQKLFAMLDQRKEFLLVPGKGHMDCLAGEEMGDILQQQLQFLTSLWS
jgi:pimeloyl-ACP methyl ester carboxylesterase